MSSEASIRGTLPTGICQSSVGLVCTWEVLHISRLFCILRIAVTKNGLRTLRSRKMFKPNTLKRISFKLALQLTNTCPSSFLALIIAKPVATSVLDQLHAFSVKPKGKTRVPAGFASAGNNGSTNESSSTKKASFARNSLLRSVRHDQMQCSPLLFSPLRQDLTTYSATIPSLLFSWVAVAEMVQSPILCLSSRKIWNK